MLSRIFSRIGEKISSHDFRHGKLTDIGKFLTPQEVRDYAGIQILKQLTVIFTAIQKMSLKSSQKLIKKKKKRGQWIMRCRNNLQNGNGKVWLKMGK